MVRRDAETVRTADWRALQGGLFLLLLALPHTVPDLNRWPLHLLAPLLACAVLAALIPPLRRAGAMWLRTGRVDRLSALAAVGVVLLSAAALILYQMIFAPDVAAAAQLPGRIAGSVVLGGLCFAVVNAVLEEVAFRGILYDALESQWGPRVALLCSSAAFGVTHLGGYPPGAFGATLAGLYGVLLGLLRQRTNGLAVPIVVHVFADLTIFGIFWQAGAF
jgi:membrane protease YdiL (CAAX protease family)